MTSDISYVHHCYKRIQLLYYINMKTLISMAYTKRWCCHLLTEKVAKIAVLPIIDTVLIYLCLPLFLPSLLLMSWMGWGMIWGRGVCARNCLDLCFASNVINMPIPLMSSLRITGWWSENMSHESFHAKHPPPHKHHFSSPSMTSLSPVLIRNVLIKASKDGYTSMSKVSNDALFVTKVSAVLHFYSVIPGPYFVQHFL